MSGYGETAQNEIGFSFIDTNATVGPQSLLTAGGGAAFFSNNAQYRTVPTTRMIPDGMYLVNEGPGAIRYMCGGPGQNQQPNAQMGILVPAGGVIDWTDGVTNYSGMIRNFQFVVVSGVAILQVSWRD